MDEPTKPGWQDTSKTPWPEDSGSEDNFGATGIFGAVKSPEHTERPAARPAIEPDAMRNPGSESPRPQPGSGAMALVEPVVHKVVFGGGAANSSAGGRSTDGLDELLRSLGSESRLPSAAPKETLSPEQSQAAPSAGFTSLLQKLGTAEKSKEPAEDFGTPVQPGAVRPNAGGPKSSPVTSGTGGFTELFRAMPGGASDSGQRPEAKPSPREPLSAPAPGGAGGFTELFRAMPAGASQGGPIQDCRPAQTSSASDGTGAAQPPADNSAGTFTKLFGTFGGASAGASVSASGPSKTEAPGSGGAGSFTQMFSVEQQNAAGQPSFREEPGPSGGNLDYDLAAGRDLSAPNRDPFSQQTPKAQPVESTPSGSGVGITRLIRMLDGPSSSPTPRMEAPAPVTPLPPAGAGLWTQTFSTLGTPNEPAAPTAKTPEWTPTQPQPINNSNEPAVSAPAPPSANAGPSEFTRILDASRMREMAMRGGQAAGAASPGPAAPPQSFATPPVTMPSYQVPAAPPMGGMPGMGGMQQPGGFPSPQPQHAAGYPMTYAPHAGAMPGGSLPQQPGIHVPTPQMPAARTAPQLKAPELGAGKLQQYIPLLLVMIIVLLIVILVTVVFLMKH